MTFTAEQTEQLLKPIAATRVLKDGKGHSHVSQQDITAHLIRVFGFGGFDTEVLDVQCVFDKKTIKIGKGRTSPDPDRYDVCYRALLRLTVKDAHGKVVAQYEDGSTATAENQTHGDAHDLAYKSALSLAKKRAAINLGDQFGLSLYNKGQETALVKGTMVHPEPTGAADGDVQAGVEQQVSLGNDEVDPDPEPEAAAGQPFAEAGFDAPGPLAQAIEGSDTPEALLAVGQVIAESALRPTDRAKLKANYTARMRRLREPVPA